MGYALKNEESYAEILCGKCGIVFYVPEHWQRTRREDKTSFYCPNGHCRIYKESESDRLKRELQEKESELQWAKSRADSLDRRLKQEAGRHKALRKRIAAGVCPCCKRTVAQLAAHMKTKHPDYIVEAPPEATKS